MSILKDLVSRCVGRTAARERRLSWRVEQLEDRTVPAPVVLDPNLAVRTVVAGLDQPTTMAFLGANDFFVLEKATGKVQHVVNGAIQSTVLDLAVNSGSERGLLGIALHPNFPTTPHVYLYWTESSTGADTTVLSQTPLLGNRVDRFVWDGSTLTPDVNIIKLRALQPPFAAEPTPAAGRGNHDGGVIKFGPDGKLYIFMGDNGRRGWMQNLVNGPYQPGDPRFGTDDNFGGPEPDDAHLTGTILRLNDDGTAPADNPFAGISHVFVARLDGAQETPPFSSSARGYAAFFLNEDMTALTLTATVAGIDFTGTQTADPQDDLVAAHIHAPGSRGERAGVVWGFFGTPFNDTNPRDVVVTPFASGAGGTVTSKWDLTEGNNTTLAAQLPNILAGRSYINFHTRRAPGGEIRGQIEENPQVTNNIHKIFSYGRRNSFGFDFDPKSGNLWLEENGDDTFTELNLVEPGENGGWIQVMGPLSRIAQFKQIETSMFGGNLQQSRWPPTNIADSPQEARDRLFMLPGAHYSDPEFSWKFEVAPAGIGFMDGRGLGPQYDGDLFVGAARPFLEGGFLWHFNLTGNRRKIGVDDPRLEDRVADNLDKPSPTDPAANARALVESESLLFGRNFGVATAIRTGPNGNLFVVSLSDGAVYEIFRAKPGGPKGAAADEAAAAAVAAADAGGLNFVTHLTGDQEAPPVETRAQGQAIFHLSPDGTELSFRLIGANIENVIAAHIHIGPVGEDGPIVAFLFGPVPAGGGRSSGVLAMGTITADDLTGPLAGQPLSALIDQMIAGNAYVNVHTSDGVPVPPGTDPNTSPGDSPDGEIRGQIRLLNAVPDSDDDPFAPIGVDEMQPRRRK
jgi:glucose/arabinose dehydrogenase